MISVKETKLTDVYTGDIHAYLDTVKAGGLVSFYVPAATPNWLDYRAVGDETDGAALTTNIFGHGIMYGEYVHGAKASAYGLDGSLSVLHFACHDTYGEHTLRRWSAGNGMQGTDPVATINLVHTYDPLTNGQESLVWIATDSFLMTALQWDAATQRMMHVIERFTAGVSAWNTIEAQRETYDPMLPPNKITSTFLSATSTKDYEIVLRGRVMQRMHTYDPSQHWVPDETPDEFMVQVSSDSDFAHPENIDTYVFPADEDFYEYGYAQAPYGGESFDEHRLLYMAIADSNLTSPGYFDNILGMHVDIVEGTGIGQSGFVYHMDFWDVEGSCLRLWVASLDDMYSPAFPIPLDATSKWRLSYKQGTKHVLIPTNVNRYVRYAQRHDGGEWNERGLPWQYQHYYNGAIYDTSWGEEIDYAGWTTDTLWYSNLVFYYSHTYTGLVSVWRVKVNNADFGATNWRVQGSVTSDFTDDPIPLDETGSFANYLQGCAVIRADTILDLTVPVAGWYIRARGENADGSIVSEWSEDVYIKTGQSNQSHSYTTYVPSYVGERTSTLCIALVATATSGYVLFTRYINSVLNQAETDEEETLFLLPVSFDGVLGTPITVVTYAGYIGYQPSIFRDGNIIYIAYYVDATHLYWKSYNTATSTLSAEHEVVLPTGYTELGYGTIWQPGGLLFTAVFDYGPPSVAHLAYVDTAVSDTLQVLTNTHADDGGMQASPGWGFWYPFVTDYDAYEDYGVAFLSMAQAHSFPWIGKFQLSHVTA